MKTSTIATILVGFGSAAIGGTVGYILGRRSKCKTCEKAEWYDRAEKACEEGEMAKEDRYFIKLEELSGADTDGDEKYPYDEYVESMKQYEQEAERYNGEEYIPGEYIKRLGETRIRRLENNQEVWYCLNDDGDEVLDDLPHEISMMSFMNDRLDDEKETLDYYVEDDILCEAHDEIVENREDIVGMIFSKLFDGVLSEDENVVYIRNPRLHADYEIIRHDSSYDKEVLGATDEQVAAAKEAFGIVEDDADDE